MERRSRFRFRLPWSQSASEPESANKTSTQPNTKTGPNRTSTRQVTRTRTNSQPSRSTATKTSPSSSPKTETSTSKQPPSTTTTTASRRPSSASAGSQGRNEAPTSTTTLTPRSPTPLPQNSAETKAPNQSTTTSTSTSPETPPIPPQPSAESKAPTQSTTKTSPLPESKPVSSQPSAESKAPIQSSTTNTSRSPETTPVLPQSSSEIKAPIQSSTINAPANPKSETQMPTTTISTTPTSTRLQRPQSSPPGVSPTRTESQPLMPSQEQQGITPQPASPSDVSTKSNVSQPPSPSPSRPASQSREMSPKSSPTGNGSQVLLTDQLTPKAALPFGMTSQEQPKDQIYDQPKSPRKQSQEIPETYSKSTETLPSISEKAPITTAFWPQSEQMELPKKEAISDTLTEAKDRLPEKVMQPSAHSGMRSTRDIAEGLPKISDSSRIISETKTARPSETNFQETKVKELEQETNDKNYAAGEKIVGPLTSKEQPDIVFKSKQEYTEKQTNFDNAQIRVNRVSNGRQTRTVSSQQRNKLVFNDSRKDTAVSAEQDIPLNKEVKDNISKFIHRMAVGDSKQNLEEEPVSVITLAGDNRGAYMQLGSDSSRKGRAIPIHRGYKLNADESADATTDAERRQPNDKRTMKDQEIEAYINCNVQGLNNSITFDSFIEGKNPGIHMSFPRMNSETIKSNEGTGLFEAHKAEFNVTRAQKHIYEPTIRRRCLEGLSSEPSDSDSDNPENPRRHGCHVGRTKKRDNDIDILETTVVMHVTNKS